MSPEADKFRAVDAKALLDNKLFREAFSAAQEYLNQKALECDSDDRDRAHRIVLSLKILAEIKRNIERHVQDGVVADFRIAEVEKRRLFSVFRR